MHARASILVKNPDGSLLSNLSGFAEGASFTLDEHGFSGFSCTVPKRGKLFVGKYWMGKTLIVGTGDTLMWRGRVEDVSFDNQQWNIQATGFWGSTRDTTINKTYVTNRMTDWRVLSNEDYSFSQPGMFSINNSGVLEFSTKLDETYSTTDFAVMAFELPENDDADGILEVEFDYEQNAVLGWRIQAQTWGTLWSSADSADWTLNSTGSSQTGSATVTFSNSTRRGITFLWFRPSSGRTETVDSGKEFCRIKNIVVRMIQDPITAQDVARDLIGIREDKVLSSTSEKLGGTGFTPGYSNVTTLVDDVDSSVDYEDLSFQNTTLQKALLSLAGISTTDGSVVEVGVYEKSRIHFRKVSDVTKHWHVFADDIKSGNSIDDIYNSVVVTYRGPNGEYLRTSVARNQASIDELNLERMLVIDTDFTDATSATNLRDSTLEEVANPPPRVTILLTDTRGNHYYGIRPNDTITVVNADEMSDIEVKNFTVKSLSYEMDTGVMTLVSQYSPAAPTSLQGRKRTDLVAEYANIERATKRVVDAR